MHRSLQNRLAGRISRTVTFGVFGFLILFGELPALAQPDGQELRYLVVWKSRYNDKDYRSEWFYGDPAIADSVANELKQFHAFTGVRVITVPIVLSPDGVSGKIAKNAQVPNNFAARGTGAFTVTDLWNYSVPGAGGGGSTGGGDAQVISLRRADSPSTAGSSATVTRPTAPAGGGQPRERLVFDENAPKGQKPVMPPSSQKTLGANERLVKEEILRSKSEVLQSEQQRLDKERSLINQGTSQGGADSKNRIEKYGSDLKNYKQLVGQYQRDLDSHQAKFNPQPVLPPSASSASRPSSAPRRNKATTSNGPYKLVVRSSVFNRQTLVSDSFDTKGQAVNAARKYNKQMVNINIKVTDRNGNNVGW